MTLTVEVTGGSPQQHRAVEAGREEEGKVRSRTEVIIFRLLLLALLVSAVLLIGLLCYSVVGRQTSEERTAMRKSAPSRLLLGEKFYYDEGRSAASDDDGPRLSSVAPIYVPRLGSDDGDDGWRLGSVAPIYVVTPTYNYMQQIVHLTRSLWLLATVPNLVWIVVQDDDEVDEYVFEYLGDQLRSMGRLPFYANHSLEVVYLARGPSEGDDATVCRGRLGRNRAFEEVYARMSFPNFAEADKKAAREDGTFVQKGVSRRHGLRFAERDDDGGGGGGGRQLGWLYFLDDDNSFSPLLFEEIRKVKKLGVWPVGNMAKVLTSSPLVFPNNTVGSFLDGYTHRQYKMDMAGFALSVDWMNAKAIEANNNFYDYWKLDQCIRGKMENIILQKAIESQTEMEPLAHSCSKVYVWHTQTRSINPIKNGYRQWLYRRKSLFLNAEPLLRDLEHHGLMLDPSARKRPPPFTGLPANAHQILQGTAAAANPPPPAAAAASANDPLLRRKIDEEEEEEIDIIAVPLEEKFDVEKK